MSLELRQQVKLTQKLVMTQQLRQAIKLLQLNRLELTNALHEEMAQNPMLEEVVGVQETVSNPESLSAEEAQDSVELAASSQVAGDDPKTVAEVDWEDYSNNFDSDFSFSREAPPSDAPSQFDFISAAPGLISFLEWQLSHLKLDEKDEDIARFILGSINGHGFFEASIEDICDYAGCSIEEAEGMLRLVQSLDPPGVAARDLRESLLLQLEREGMEDDLAYLLVADHLDELQTHNFTKIAAKIDYTAREVRNAFSVITSLNPYPGNEYSNEQTNYVVPDVYLHRLDGEFIIQLNNDGMPQLQLSAEYQELMKDKAGTDSKGYLTEQKRNAQNFINSVHYRQNSIYKVMKSLLKFQHDFFEQGPGHLKPLVLNDVAQDIGLHESTVSRITSNKYVHTPQGLYELKFFFSSAVTTTDGNLVASEVIKNRIRQLIQQEPPEKPLSDNLISEMLKEEGVNVARRTVAKYRDQMKILPVKHRRKSR
ncbi:MAG: RNA polymerase factor sigma-54 [Candidatus Electrothrix aestuarii]|uniref:RNA polymerase factor sigma-54 n=1 Tax=Candidatus Electrothrix aestuarii TaxID=3062594 RepID=A0AAU8LYS5_9BACT|nr:RNA polymerase factor sigma-54 [Candidatus Electrothrix aestuarii]